MKMYHRMAAGKVKNLYDHALLTRVVLQFFWHSSQFPSLNRGLTEKSNIKNPEYISKEDCAPALSWSDHIHTSISALNSECSKRRQDCETAHLHLTLQMHLILANSNKLARMLAVLCPQPLLSLINRVMISETNITFILCSGKSYSGAWATVSHLWAILIGNK